MLFEAWGAIKVDAVLEGIGLSVDPDYSIVNETLPYVSRRIVTDPSPRTAGALETFVFGDEKEAIGARVLDAERVAHLEAYKKMGASSDGTNMADVELLNEQTLRDAKQQGRQGNVFFGDDGKVIIKSDDEVSDDVIAL